MELTIFAASVAGAAALSAPLVSAKRRIALSLAKHRSLAGHARLAQRIASRIPFYEYKNIDSSDRTIRRRTLRFEDGMAFCGLPPSTRNGLRGRVR